MSAVEIVDLDARKRLGIRGGELTRWLDANRYSSAPPNQAIAQPDGSLLLTLSPMELVWLAADEMLHSDLRRVDEDYLCYTVQRQDSYCWFALQGQPAPLILAKLCGVDLSSNEFDSLSIAQTSLARISAVIVRDCDDSPKFHILADSSLKAYLHAALVDASAEFGSNQM